MTENPHVKAGLTWAGIIWGIYQELCLQLASVDLDFALLWIATATVSNPPVITCRSVVSPGQYAAALLGFRRMTGAIWRSAFVAALFAWHPVHVESVAWVAEREDVLSTFFWLLTMLAYARYAQMSSPSAKCGVGGGPKSFTVWRWFALPWG